MHVCRNNKVSKTQKTTDRNASIPLMMMTSSCYLGLESPEDKGLHQLLSLLHLVSVVTAGLVNFLKTVKELKQSHMAHMSSVRTLEKVFFS